MKKGLTILVSVALAMSLVAGAGAATTYDSNEDVVATASDEGDMEADIAVASALGDAPTVVIGDDGMEYRPGITATQYLNKHEDHENNIYTLTSDDDIPSAFDSSSSVSDDPDPIKMSNEVALSEFEDPGDVVVVDANNTNSLAVGSSLAYDNDAPLLLVEDDEGVDEASDTIDELDPSTVHISPHVDEGEFEDTSEFSGDYISEVDDSADEVYVVDDRYAYMLFNSVVDEVYFGDEDTDMAELESEYSDDVTVGAAFASDSDNLGLDDVSEYNDVKSLSSTVALYANGVTDLSVVAVNSVEVSQDDTVEVTAENVGLEDSETVEFEVEVDEEPESISGASSEEFEDGVLTVQMTDGIESGQEVTFEYDYVEGEHGQITVSEYESVGGETGPTFTVVDYAPDQMQTLVEEVEDIASTLGVNIIVTFVVLSIGAIGVAYYLTRKEE